jgi:hypothetical protein
MRSDATTRHRTPTNAVDDIPFSRIAGRMRIGSDFFRSQRLIDLATGRTPCGLVDDLGVHARPGLDPDQIDPGIRSFYEDTAAWGLVVRCRWQRPWRTAGRLYKPVSRFLGQMNFPSAAENVVDSLIVPIDETRDGRPGVRGWIRTYRATEAAVYVAAYATHRHDELTFMNIAFPLPGGNLASIMRMDAVAGEPGHSGVQLSTVGSSHEGIYWVRRGRGRRLPMDETICVLPREHPAAIDWPNARPRATLVARHVVVLSGRPLLQLDYELFPKS